MTISGKLIIATHTDPHQTVNLHVEVAAVAKRHIVLAELLKG
jgi:hypothetical protein